MQPLRRVSKPLAPGLRVSSTIRRWAETRGRGPEPGDPELPVHDGPGQTGARLERMRGGGADPPGVPEPPSREAGQHGPGARGSGGLAGMVRLGAGAADEKGRGPEPDGGLSVGAGLRRGAERADAG